MKTIKKTIMKKTILETKFINEFGETMILKLDEDNVQWFSHNDCNEDFEKMEDLKKNESVAGYKISFKYILDGDEKRVLRAFEETCKQIEREEGIPAKG